MPIPLALAVPAAAAGLAYLNVKTGFWYDRTLLRAAIPALYHNSKRERTDRCSSFYVLEQKATSKSSRNHPYILFQDKSWTFGQVYEIALKYGNWFKTKFDVKPKDIVAINLQNSDYFVFICFGLWSIGAKPAFINYNLTGQALVHCVKTAEPVLMLVDPEIAFKVDGGVREKLEGLRIELLTDELKAEVAAIEAIRPPDSLRSGQLPKDMAILINTSGTTGLPKAAIISWKKLTVVGSFVSSWLATKPSDVFYTCMPLYHSSATIMAMAHCLESGATLALGKKFSTKTFWKEARQYKATMIQYVGETCRYLLAAPPQIDPFTGENMDKKHNIKLAFGNGLRPDIWNKFKERFGIDGIAEFYGATEGSLALFNYTRNDFASGGIGYVGLLFTLVAMVSSAIIALDPETDAPIRDPKTGFCRRVKRGDVGELLFKLPGEPEGNFQGYYNDPKATESKIMRDVLQKGDHFFRSGDLVSWDREGVMRFHDRMGDTFRWKSENVATTEVSEALGSHPAVQEANVYGVQLPNHDGRAGCAALVLSHGQLDDALLQSLADHVRRKLPKYAVPIFLRLGKGLTTQVTDTNKQKKHELRLQGVNPALIGDDELYWLKSGTYVKFNKNDWDRLNAGQVKL
ncbi:acetyl-CoA synthetase-like protein [Annulohypoxylon maeteangense]|uniref:acetyl-CoA synthetase-like protein n=1 Tax=Annulohypoxylon maeteangense TaxID=1927788 RepID=UPI002008DE24|nr:acetyl-CoA synthetase-like protein [Annulohypoxylon maeteangense]KAI0881366.1 acetyl-CoA synthetase-like protein [Annulohypoxylon maeteangense]